MILLYVLLFVFGIALSGFFSGNETGLYRVPRMRLVLDGLSGQLIPRCLLYLANHPTLFVATVLVGNNIANYLSSFAVVAIIPRIVGPGYSGAELIGSIAITPLVFVLGELLPKYLYFHAPYRLLRLTGPILILVCLLFLPISIVLVALGAILSSFTGGTPFQSQLRIARSELQQVLREGHDIGLLKRSQQQIAQNVWVVGEQPAKAFAMALDRLARIRLDTPLPDAVTEARRHGHPLVIVEADDRILGYVRYLDLVNEEFQIQERLRATIRVPEQSKNLAVLFSLYDANSDIAELIDESGAVVAIVTRRQLQEPLMTI